MAWRGVTDSLLIKRHWISLPRTTPSLWAHRSTGSPERTEESDDQDGGHCRRVLAVSAHVLPVRPQEPRGAQPDHPDIDGQRAAARRPGERGPHRLPRRPGP